MDLDDRNSRSYAWRRVVAHQGDMLVVHAAMSFGARPTPEVRVPAQPRVPGPDTESDRGTYIEHLGMGLIDTCHVAGPPPDRLARGERADCQDLWVRPTHAVRGRADLTTLMAFLSDIAMLSAPMMALGEVGDGERCHCASVDHSLRYYSPLEQSDWLLVRQRTTVLDGRILESRSTACAPDGRLVFTATQQGMLLRPKPAPIN